MMPQNQVWYTKLYMNINLRGKTHTHTPKFNRTELVKVLEVEEMGFQCRLERIDSCSISNVKEQSVPERRAKMREGMSALILHFNGSKATAKKKPWQNSAETPSMVGIDWPDSQLVFPKRKEA